jgi:hypothetical protein
MRMVMGPNLVRCRLVQDPAALCIASSIVVLSAPVAVDWVRISHARASAIECTDENKLILVPLSRHP